MKKCCAISLLLLLFTELQAQVANTGMTDRADSLEHGKVKISGYVDTYYGFDFNHPATSDRAYAISSPRHNEVNINLAYIDLKYRNDRVRARFIPGVGNYINSNYAAEQGTLRNIIEANAGVKLSKTKEVWIDVGVMGAPFTNESAISKDHLLYTRSFAPEYTPYYFSGVRLTYPFSQKVTGYFYIMNGWQQISDVNNPLSVATQIEYTPGKKWLFNWNTYIGNEKSPKDPENRYRYFTDVYAIFNPDGKFSMTSCVYGGWQTRVDTITGQQHTVSWWQANLMGRYRFTDNVSLSGRVEYFEDPFEVTIQPVTSVTGFSTYSSALCLNINITHNAIFRIEGRNYFSAKKVYIDKNLAESTTDNLIIGNLTVWF
jgi:hypothetical protein